MLKFKYFIDCLNGLCLHTRKVSSNYVIFRIIIIVKIKAKKKLS